jgi:3-isopropylmalate/(R)-2-methylmalate dehydratase small subunit
MEKFAVVRGIVAPLERANVDTDQIIPKQFLKSIRRTGFGENLFDAWRYRDAGHLGKPAAERRLDARFVLNQARYRGASILLAGENFGCGSSREHAVWALVDYGFRVVIAPSFGDIFFSNCFSNGLLAVKLRRPELDELFSSACGDVALTVAVDLPAQLVTHEAAKRSFRFEIDPFHKFCLEGGLDQIGMTLQHADAIKAFELQSHAAKPWLA